jgi:peptidyl-tRNA hydrolase, PTH1 family
MKLVVGLGNPGSEYHGTRHNIGFEVIDRLAGKLGWAEVTKKRFDGLALDGNVELPTGGAEKMILLKPLTFMNLSGKAVQSAMSFYQLLPADILIVLDDLALPCGRLRLRGSGTSGGHNGLKDIERALGTNEYPRLRIGIDPAPPPMRGKDYVLGRFTPEQRKLLEPTIDRACNAILTWMEKGIASAMSQFNAEEQTE